MLALSFIFQFFIIVRSPEAKVDNTQRVLGFGSIGNLIGIDLADKGVASHWADGTVIEECQMLPFNLVNSETGELLVKAMSDDTTVITKGCGGSAVELPIKEINEFLAGDNRALTVDYFLNQSNGQHYTLDSDGNNPTYVPADDEWIQYETGVPTIDGGKIVMFTVVYKDSRSINVTLNCALSGEGYMINVYKGDEIYKQMYVTTATYAFKLEFVSNYSNTYRLAFVFGYYGNLTFDAKNATTGVNTNITTATRSATINSLVDTTIKFALANPRINSTIII